MAAPTVALCQQEDFLVDQFELATCRPRNSRADGGFHGRGHAAFRRKRTSGCSRSTFAVRADFEEVYKTGCTGSSADTHYADEQRHVPVSITTGTHVQQICLFMLAEVSAYFRPAAASLAAAPQPDRAGRCVR